MLTVEMAAVGGETGHRLEATVSTPARLVSSSAIVRKVPSRVEVTNVTFSALLVLLN